MCAYLNVWERNGACKFMRKSELRFGLEKHVTIQVGTSQVNNVFPINKFEYMATTRSGLYKFERGTIKKSYAHPFSCSVYIKEYDLIAGVSALGSELAIYDMMDLSQPLIDHIRTDQIAVFHLLYSPKSHSIICFGSGVQVYSLKFTRPKHISMAKPEITVTKRSFFAPDFEPSIMNTPCFDFNSEMVYLPTKKGFQKFDLDGKEGPLASKVSSNSLTCADLLQDNKKFLTSHSCDGVFLWEKMGSLEQKFPGSNSALLALRFITKEFVIFLDATLNIFILDIKTNKCTVCCTLLKKPNKFIVADKRLILCDGPEVQIYDIVLPFTLWAGKTTQPLKLRRCSKFNCAARIVAFCSNRMYHVFSPQTGERITHAVVTEQSIPFDFFYDRGLAVDRRGSELDWNYHNLEDHDVLFTMTNGGPMCAFGTMENPCTQQSVVNNSITSIVICNFNGKLCYCMANDLGELMFYDYHTFVQVNRFLIQKRKICCVYYHVSSESIIVLFENEVVRFDMNRQASTHRVFTSGQVIAELIGNTLFLGCQDGTIKTVEISSSGMVLRDEGARAFHTKEITDMKFHRDFFITVSKDQYLKVWDYELCEICRVWMPYQLSSCEILNGKRDILVGTDSDIVIIDGKLLFDCQDEENSEIDNYDRLEDQLVTEALIMRRNRKEELERANRSRSQRQEAPNSEMSVTRSPLRRAPCARSSVYTKQDAPTVDAKRTMTAEDKRRIIAEMAKITDSICTAPVQSHDVPEEKIEEIVPIEPIDSCEVEPSSSKMSRTPSSKEVLAALIDGTSFRKLSGQDSSRRRARRKARKRSGTNTEESDEQISQKPSSLTSEETAHRTPCAPEILKKDEDPTPSKFCLHSPKFSNQRRSSTPTPIWKSMLTSTQPKRRSKTPKAMRLVHNIPEKLDSQAATLETENAHQDFPVQEPQECVRVPSIPPEGIGNSNPRNKKSTPQDETPITSPRRLSRNTKDKDASNSQKNIHPLSLLQVSQQRPTCFQPIIVPPGVRVSDRVTGSSKRHASPPIRRANDPLPSIAHRNDNAPMVIKRLQ